MSKLKSTFPLVFRKQITSLRNFKNIFFINTAAYTKHSTFKKIEKKKENKASAILNEQGSKRVNKNTFPLLQFSNFCQPRYGLKFLNYYFSFFVIIFLSSRPILCCRLSKNRSAVAVLIYLMSYLFISVILFSVLWNRTSKIVRYRE